MKNALDALIEAQKFAMSTRPRIGGFPYLAEVLRRAGVQKNIWSLPSCQALYIMDAGNIVQQGTPLVTGMSTVPNFDQDALILALRTDQAGKSTFTEFLLAAWKAGVIGYDVDLNGRKVIYFGSNGEKYTEDYPAIEVNCPF